jgi:hypothetical protein
VAVATVNLLSVAGNPTGKIAADLEYDDATLKCTAVIYSNTSPDPYPVNVIRASDGVSRQFTVPAGTVSDRRALPNNFASVAVVGGDVIPPFEVEGG